MAAPSEITTSQLSRLIGTPDCPLLLDVRIDTDFEDDPRILPAALRWRYDDMAGFARDIGAEKVVVYCQKGRKISQGAAAMLRSLGIVAETLEGGHFAWRDAGLPLIPAEKIPQRTAKRRTVWVTRQRPKIDRIACPWLIRRFVDPRAQFLFVAPPEVADVAEKFDATPFDIEDVFWSHRGPLCTFDVMVEEFGLIGPAMDRLATIVRGADTDRHDLAPQAAGLLAASLGLSRMFRDDLTQLEAGLLLYDAFYRWSRDAVDEGHTWPAALAKG